MVTQIKYSLVLSHDYKALQLSIDCQTRVAHLIDGALAKSAALDFKQNN
jgi:hypothetical protein